MTSLRLSLALLATTLFEAHSQAASAFLEPVQNDEASLLQHSLVRIQTGIAARARDEVDVKKHDLIEEASALNVWPMPTNVASKGQGSASISPALTFAGDVSDPFIKKVVERYKELIFPHKAPDNGDIKTIKVSLGSNGGENYTLEVTPKEVRIGAEAPAGVQYASETLSQLVSFDFDAYLYRTQPVLPLSVKDEPRYPHRGLLIDSARHWLSVLSIKRLIRSLSYAKLNRLHWHITDAQSFPINSRVEPSLASKGAWSSQERYSPEDVKEIVQYAKEHGILVVPEFDMPGHTKSWGNARPELEALTQDPGDGNSGALNPTKEETFSLVQRLLKDWLGENRGNESLLEGVRSTSHGPFFDTPMIHLGTDEVPYAAWKSFGDSKALFSNFVDRITQMAHGLGKDLVLWEEAFKDGKPSQKAIIQVWLDKSIAQSATDAGNRVLLSQGWYLDHLNENWESMYSNDPASLISADKAQLMLGGEGCMWGETVDGGDLEQTVWPRLGAIAERLWGSASHVHQAKKRLATFRCLLLERGILCGTLEGPGRSTPSGPGSCDKQ